MSEENTVQRCGTCKRWRPRKERDVLMNGHYGSCKWEIPALPSCIRSIDKRDIASTAGEFCPKWLAGGKHGALT